MVSSSYVMITCRSSFALASKWLSKDVFTNIQASLGFIGLWKQKERTMLLMLGVSQLHIYIFFFAAY